METQNTKPIGVVIPEIGPVEIRNPRGLHFEVWHGNRLLSEVEGCIYDRPGESDPVGVLIWERTQSILKGL